MAIVGDAQPPIINPSVVTRGAKVALASACCGWMFDSLDLNLFTLLLFPSVSELIGSTKSADVASIGGLIVAMKLFGWGLGGIVFGVVADRIGRSRTMIITILIYSIFTGLSGLAQNWQQMMMLQAIAGIGIGGEWAAGAALVAEVWPERSRATALLIMQMSFGFGNFLAAGANYFVGPYGWRWEFLVGAAPALLTLIIRFYAPESERWIAVRERERMESDDSAMKTFRAIFQPPIRRRTFVGVAISLAMMIGAWGGLVLLPTWVNQLLGAEAPTRSVATISQVFFIMNVGAVVGYLSLIWLVDWLGRRGSYFLFCTGSFVISVLMFTQVKSVDQLFYYIFFLGLFANGGYGVFAVYLPELFPTRFRATGQGFCWNAARMVTGVGPLVTGLLVGAFGSVSSAALGMSWVFLLGSIAIWFGPETRKLGLQD